MCKSREAVTVSNPATGNINAIETRYAGYRFRSRREARWAVFLNHLDIPWEYEPQGYRLADGSTYLPDFLVYPDTDLAFWFEVKGSHPTGKELAKAQGLATGTGRTVYVYFGAVEPPGIGLTRAIGADESAFYSWTGSHIWLNESGWAPYLGGGVFTWAIDLIPTAYRVDPATERFPVREPQSNHFWWTDCAPCRQVILKLHGQQGFCPSDSEEGADPLYPNFRHETSRLLAAYSAARSARFEHGEIG